MIKECLYCRSEFKTSDKRRKFCNQGCYLSYKKDNIELYNDTIFNKGHKPWNKDLKGVMKPNKTSFKKGRSNPNKKEIGCESLRKSNGRVFVKVANPNKWRYRAVCVWESIYGKIKKRRCGSSYRRD